MILASSDSASSAQVTAALISSLVVGVIGISTLIFSFFNGKWDRANRAKESAEDRKQALTLAREERDHQLEVLRRQGEHDLLVVREERMFDQRRDTYAEALDALNETQDWVAATYPILSRTGQDVRPDFPNAEERSDLGSRIAVFGSAEVFEAVQEYRRLAFYFSGIASEIDAYIQQHADQGQARMDLQNQREALSRQLVRVAELMRDELRRPEPPAVAPQA